MIGIVVPTDPHCELTDWGVGARIWSHTVTYVEVFGEGFVRDIKDPIHYIISAMLLQFVAVRFSIGHFV